MLKIDYKLKIKNLKLKIRTKSSGQVALMVLLVSAVVMTIGLGVSKKTVVTNRVETNEEQLKQAFNTAESGVEYYLGTGSTKFTAIDNLSVADVVVKNIGEGSTINYDQYLLANANLVYWLVGHTPSGEVDFGTFYGGNSLSLCIGEGFGGGVKADYFYQDAGGVFRVKRMGFNLTADAVEGFSNISPTQGNCAAGYREQLLVPVGAGVPLAVVIKPIGGGGKFYLLGSGANFPVQGLNISSTGRVGDINTGVRRKLNVVETYQLPSFMLEAITAAGSVLSN